MTLHHVALGARDVERVAAFYRDVLGLAEVARQPDRSGGLRSIWLRLGEGVLMVERTEHALRNVEGVGAGAFLIALAIDPDQRVACEARLTSAGAPVEARTEHTSYSRDPEGNRVAVSSYPLPPP